MKSFMNTVKLQRSPRSYFDLSHDRKFSMRMGELTPSVVIDCVPDDRITMSTTQMFRMAPLVAPIMHRVDVRTEYFKVPLRIMWDGAEDFFTGVTPQPVSPFIRVNWKLVAGDLLDYLGIPIGDYSSAPLTISAFPVSAYFMVHNEYYRDENLQPDMDWSLSDGDNTALFLPYISPAGTNNARCFKRCWEKDLFTSALPFKQKGAAVTMPLGNTAPVRYAADGEPSVIKSVTGVLLPGPGAINYDALGHIAGAIPASIDNSDQLYVDLANANSATVEAFRLANVLQRYLERKAIGGTRYTEFIKSIFGVTSSDSRLQRPEYLGGGKSPISISEVLQTSETSTSPQGNIAGHGVNVGNNRSFSTQFEEWGYIIGMVSVMPQTAYFQGLEKHWSRFDPLQYLNPMFAHLGEEGITNKEVYVDHLTAVNRDKIFGYQRRFYEYCTKLSSVHGEFLTTQSYWHMARRFSSQPALNSNFVECTPTTDIFAVTEGVDTMYCHMFHNIKALRQLPLYGTPSTV